jgi:hypothetical protein
LGESAPCRRRVRCDVREAVDRQASGIDDESREHEVERAIQECDVLANRSRIAFQTRIGRRDDDSRLIGSRPDASELADAVPPRAM